jgi:hypothetical protein
MTIRAPELDVDMRHTGGIGDDRRHPAKSSPSTVEGDLHLAVIRVLG